jgi:predicted RNase H-like nuclease (RuvC/YqgF family)
LVRSGIVRTARALDETVSQLQQQIRELQNQIRAERAQNSTLCREVSEARLEILRRDRDDAFAAAPSPSAAVR